MKSPATQLVYVGTYAPADSDGIEIFALNKKTGHLQYLGAAAAGAIPSYLRLSPDRRFLYAVNEITDFEGKPTGTVSAFRVDSVSGRLSLINRVETHGRAPCYLDVSANGRFVLVNNYLDGTAVSVAVRPDGELGKVVSIVRQTGSGPNKKRQEGPPVHPINLAPLNPFAVTADLGTDLLTVYRFDSTLGVLTPLPGKTAHTAPGAGPRHLVFSADGRRVYVANELNNTVECFNFNPETGDLQRFQTITAVPPDFSGTNYPADIHLSPDGKFLYVSNRGAESLAIFSVDSQIGQLTFLTTQPVHGSWPRNFILSPDGKFVLVANQKSRALAIFHRNPSTGFLTWISSVQTKAPPACIKIATF